MSEGFYKRIKDYKCPKCNSSMSPTGGRSVQTQHPTPKSGETEREHIEMKCDECGFIMKHKRLELKN